MARILVVDDSATIRNYVELSVAPKGYEVVTAVDGQEGITKLEAEGPFDLLIVDLMMPNLNGFGFMNYVRETLGDDAPKMLVLTAEVERMLLWQAKSAGAAAWISKPVDSETLLAAVEKLTGAVSP